MFLGCPQADIDGDIWRLFWAARQAEKGNWPVTGGWLDQSQNFLDAIDAVNESLAFWKLSKPSGH